MYLAARQVFLIAFSAGSLCLWAQTGQPPALKSFDLTAIDRAANPCDDFYQYACGTWIKSNPIPPDQWSWRAAAQVAERNQIILRGILEKVSDPKQRRNPDDQRIGDFYASCLDEKAIEDKGTSPIDADLSRIAKLKDKKEVAAEVAHLHAEGVPVFFWLAARPDEENSAQVIANVRQAGLGLPDRDYYLRTDARSRQLRDKYLAHVAKVFQLLGSDPDKAASQAKAVMAIETALAKVSLDRVALRDPNNVDHHEPVAQLSALAPDFAWKSYLADRSVAINNLNIAEPDFLKGLNALLGSTSLDGLKTYMSWHVLNTDAQLLPEAFVNEDFDFNQRVVLGVKTIKPRWKRC